MNFYYDLYNKFIVCPSCNGKLRIDAFELRNSFIDEGIMVCDACHLWFPIIRSIPRIIIPDFLRTFDDDFIRRWSYKLEPYKRSEPMANIPEFETVKQVKTIFAYKWSWQNWWGMEGATADFLENWILARYGWMDKNGYKNFFADKETCLDAGCGLGREAIRMAQANPNMLVIGIELSECIEEARRHAEKRGLKNVFFIQADITYPPIAKGSIDFIISEGVLHHTRDTKRALMSLSYLLVENGEIGFYIYRKKAVIREFADDYLRQKIAALDPETAWRELEPITRLGKALADLKVKIKIDTDIPLLGIKAGEYDLQRFIYYNFLKCFWNDQFTFEENNHVNFDWYAPKYAWRHTEEEVKEWLKELSLLLIHEHVEESGITVRARKVNVSQG